MNDFRFALCVRDLCGVDTAPGSAPKAFGALFGSLPKSVSVSRVERTSVLSAGSRQLHAGSVRSPEALERRISTLSSSLS